MEHQSINLNNTMYHDFLSGKEIVFITSQKPLKVGDHLIVYKNTLAATSSVSVPTTELQSDSIGVEGIVTNAKPTDETSQQITLRKL